MKIFSRTRTEQSPAHVGVPILVRFWQEDGVWNASAFDLSVAVFGDNFDDARQHFEEALDSHFDLLVEMGRAKDTIDRLKKLADVRGFYEERMNSRETVSRFEVPSEMEECYA